MVFEGILTLRTGALFENGNVHSDYIIFNKTRINAYRGQLATSDDTTIFLENFQVRNFSEFSPKIRGKFSSD